MRRPLYLIVLSIFLSSCIDNLDFSQVEDYDATRVYDFALFYFSTDQSRFKDINHNDIYIPITDETNFTIFTDHTYIRDNVSKIELDFEVTNQFNNDFKVELYFLNSRGNIIYKTEEKIVEKNTNKLLLEEDISIQTTPNIINTTKIKSVITLLPNSDGTFLDFTEPKKIEVKSVGKFFLKS